MIIKIERGIWHIDCSKNEWNSGVIKELKYNVKTKKTLVECLHCGQKGYIPDGTLFKVKVCIEDLE